MKPIAAELKWLDYDFCSGRRSKYVTWSKGDRLRLRSQCKGVRSQVKVRTNREAQSFMAGA